MRFSPPKLKTSKSAINLDVDETPSPQHYRIPEMKYNRGSSFSVSNRFYAKEDEIPGPGTYKLPDAPNNAAVIFQKAVSEEGGGRSSFIFLTESPGPGAYDLNPTSSSSSSINNVPVPLFRRPQTCPSSSSPDGRSKTPYVGKEGSGKRYYGKGMPVDESLLTPENGERGDYQDPDKILGFYKQKGRGVRMGGGERESFIQIPDYDYYEVERKRDRRMKKGKKHGSSKGKKKKEEEEEEDESKRERKKAQKKKKGEEYKFIHDYLESIESPSTSGKLYKKSTDGLDMPRSRPFKRPSTMQFSRSDRFTNKLFDKCNPARGLDSPGPCYEINEEFFRTQRTPIFSQTKIDRTLQEVQQAKHEDVPGVGSYDTTIEARLYRLSQRMEERVMQASRREERQKEEEGEKEEVGEKEEAMLSPELRELERYRPMSEASRSLAMTSTSLTLRDGNIVGSYRPPGFVFSHSSRDDMLKMSLPNDFQNILIGRESPGPGSSFHDPPLNIGGGKFSNFEVERNPIPTQSSDIGPAAYGQFNGVGKQVLSNRPNPPSLSFTRSKAKNNVYTGLKTF